MSGYEDNIGDVLRSYDEEFATEAHVLELKNAMGYALYLHMREGISVFNNSLLIKMTQDFLQGIVRSGKPITDETIEEALKHISDEYIAVLQGFTGGLRPPVKAGGPNRPEHPHGWADRTTDLASSFMREVDGGSQKKYDYSGQAYV